MLQIKQDYSSTEIVSHPGVLFMTFSDLLEIVGQARDPAPVNKHIGKIPKAPMKRSALLH
jgi:hypothetical protein